MSHTFTDRRGGFSSGAYESLNLALHVNDDPAVVVRNRARLGSVQFMNQVHGNEVLVVDTFLPSDPTCDGLITTNPDLTLAVMVADCIPLLLVSKEAVAAVHVGRAGIVNRVAKVAVEKMRALGADKIHALLGPSICGQCYEVPFELQQTVVAEHPAAMATTRHQSSALDLPAALIAQLVELDLSYEASMVCTLEDPLYFSHRRENPTGRFAGLVKL